MCVLFICSVWTLKALDHHVVSDEEIIEDAVFGGHFGTMHPSLKYDHVPFAKKVSSRLIIYEAVFVQEK